MKKIYVVGGPTATGKTKFAIKLAKKVDGLIINADSVQIYKYLDIGSNKGNIEKVDEIQIDNLKFDIYDIENSGVRGLMFNVVEPEYNFSVYDYQNYVLKIIKNFVNINLILVGGTGLYIDSILKDYKIPEKTEINSYTNLTLDQLQNELKEKKPKIFKNLNNSDANNPVRIKNLLLNKSEKVASKFRFDYEFFYPIFEREKLYSKINKRVLEMMSEGFENEVRNLIKMGYTLDNKVMNSTGYKQLFEFIQGRNTNIKECLEKIMQAHRNYAKRQITWFEGESRKYNLTRVDFANYL